MYNNRQFPELRSFVIFIVLSQISILHLLHSLHLLSSYSGVQKVCKNVQSQNQPLKTAPDFYAMG